MLLDILLANLWGLPCWLWLLLAGIIPFILGWLLRSTFSRKGDSKETSYSTSFQETTEYRTLQDQINAYEKTDAELKYKLEQSEIALNDCRSSKQSNDMERLMYKAKLEELGELDGLSLSASAPKSTGSGISYGSLFGADNLQVVEGVGPKVEKLLKDNGYADLAALGAADPVKLKEILVANKLQMMNPDSWPHQAKLASSGDWEELIKYQKFLDTGRETSGDFETPAKVEKMAMKLLGFSQNPEDLKIVEGIGPKIEGLLKDAGINTWTDLAGTSVDRIKEVLTAAGDRYKLAKPDTWPKQAGLAAEGKWGELQEYQDYLDKGVDPAKS